ncbi:MAG: PQQ-binding-like beta-propeller repeat protein, partial [Rubripirellula sp.]
MTRLIALSCLLFLLPALVHADGWKRFRGDSGSGVSGGGIPAEWSDTKNLAWKTELPGKGSSSPVVVGDRVFITAYSGYGISVEEPGDRSSLRLHVICLSLSEGKILWDESIEAAPEEQNVTKRVADHGYASPTPCVDDNNVYAYFGPSGLVAFSQA